jgi:hypothetical protein
MNKMSLKLSENISEHRSWKVIFKPKTIKFVRNFQYFYFGVGEGGGMNEVI